jgi:adenine-specific DNA-methyltransferase
MGAGYVNAKGASALEQCGLRKCFNYAKPVELIRDLARLSTDDDSIVLDFFAGSSTTAHAVMELNAREGSRRGFIMVQLPEAPARNSAAYRAGYATLSGLGMERIRRAGDDLRKRYPEAGLDNGFRVYCVK